MPNMQVKKKRFFFTSKTNSDIVRKSLLFPLDLIIYHLPNQPTLLPEDSLTILASSRWTKIIIAECHGSTTEISRWFSQSTKRANFNFQNVWTLLRTTYRNVFNPTIIFIMVNIARNPGNYEQVWKCFERIIICNNQFPTTLFSQIPFFFPSLCLLYLWVHQTWT